MNKLYRYITSPRRSTRDLSTNILITALLAVLFTLINPNFIGNYNLVSIGQNLAPYAVLSLGVLFPIAMGGIDLSVGTTCVGAAVVAGKLYESGMPLWGVIPVMLLFGLLVGLVNGLIISRYKIQPFIVTLGTMMFVRGIAAIYAAKASVLYPANCWYNHLFSNYNSFPMGALWILLLAAIVYFVFRKTRCGRYFVSIGSNENSTRISGVDIEKYKCIGYALSGLMAGMAGIFWSASFATVTVATGNGMELDAIAGVYIGGTSALGGIANVWGSVIGAIMLVVIRSGLNFSLARLNISINSTYVTYVISGLVVVIAVLIERMREENFSSRKRKGRSSERRTVIVKCASAGLSVIMIAFLCLVGSGAVKLKGMNAQDERKTLCLLMKTEGQDFWNILTEGATAVGEENGYRVICRGPESEDPSFLPKQLELADSMLSDKTAGIGLATLANGFTDYLEKAYERGIPVIQFDSGLHAKDVEAVEASGKNPLVSFVKADNYANAGLAAEKTFEAVREDIAAAEEYTVGIIQHEDSETASLRAKGFEDRFIELAEGDPATAGRVTVITEVKPSGSNNAYQAGLEYLYEKGARTIYMTAWTVAHQVIDAIQASNDKYNGMKFATYDVTEKLTEWIKMDMEAELLGAIDQNPYLIGRTAAETLIQAINGEAPEEEALVQGIWYNKENIDERK